MILDKLPGHHTEMGLWCCDSQDSRVHIMWHINHTFPVFNSANVNHFHSGKQETGTLENSDHADGMLTVC